MLEIFAYIDASLKESLQTIQPLLWLKQVIEK